MAECSTDSSSGFAGSEPRVNLELLFTGFSVGDELEIEVEMLEVASKGSSGSCDLDDLGLDLDFDSLRDVHGLRRQDCLHLVAAAAAAAAVEWRVCSEAGNPRNGGAVYIYRSMCVSFFRVLLMGSLLLCGPLTSRMGFGFFLW
ncbi:hypothetical protein Hanom_Chr12g01133971 [Helianthus anomalus]